MERQISEADWKRFRKLSAVALDRFCERVLAEIARLAMDDTTTHHQRYLAVVKLLKERDREMAATFNDARRSMALLQLARMRSLGLVTDAEFAQFGPVTQRAVATLLEI